MARRIKPMQDKIGTAERTVGMSRGIRASYTSFHQQPDLIRSDHKQRQQKPYHITIPSRSTGRSLWQRFENRTYTISESPAWSFPLPEAFPTLLSFLLSSTFAVVTLTAPPGRAPS